MTYTRLVLRPGYRADQSLLPCPMPYLDLRLARQLNHTLAAFHEEPAGPNLAARLACALAELLGLETACFDAYEPAGMYHVGGNAPEFFSPTQLLAMAGRIEEHPLYGPAFRQFQAAPFKISDYLSVARYQRTDFYNDFYRPLHLVHQLGTLLHVPGQPPISCVLTRTHRDFTETDRLLLTLLQPHLQVLLRQLPAPAPAGPPPAPGFTPRELDVLRYLAQGCPDKEIARRCGISSRTVQVHLRNIYAKLGVDNRTAAAVLVQQ